VYKDTSRLHDSTLVSHVAHDYNFDVAVSEPPPTMLETKLSSTSFHNVVEGPTPFVNTFPNFPL